MIRAELYLLGRPLVILERDASTNPGAWARLQEALSRGTVGGGPARLEVRADVFLAELESLRDVRSLYAESIDYGPQVREQLQQLAHDRRALKLAEFAPDLGHADLDARLSTAGFRRQLKTFQNRNLQRLMRLPHGADFSVPGSGKTTVALANFFLQRAAGHTRR